MPCYARLPLSALAVGTPQLVSQDNSSSGLMDGVESPCEYTTVWL